MTSLDLVASNLLSPPILAFAFGILAVFVKSDLKVPDPLYQGITIYLLFSIGFKGGSSLSDERISDVIAPLLGAVGIASLIPLLTFFVCRVILRFAVRDAAALAAHYGSVSAVTFIATLVFLEQNSIKYESYVTALMAIMEIPAIVIALLLAQVFGRKRKIKWNDILHEVGTNRSVFLLIAGLVTGALTGKDGLEKMSPFLIDPFYGVLTFFLLEMGLVAGEKLKDLRLAGVRLIVFALTMPLVQAWIGIWMASLVGLSQGGAVVFAVLAASASYIAAPAVIRNSLPEANPAFYVTASLAITFPFNLTVGIPLYAYWVDLVW
ncbi:MAG: sodium-dependent bicarbonate transport family permease [Verrucomicrobiota bacterium]